MNKRAVFGALVLLFALGGCSAQREITGRPAAQPTSHVIDADAGMLERMNPTTSVPEPTPASRPAAGTITPPAKDQVLNARTQALEGMTEEQTNRLNEVITGANGWWEYRYLERNIFGNLEDPDGLAWNYFHETGLIPVDLDYTGDLDVNAICEEEGLSWREFCEKYGTEDTLGEFLDYNEHTADDFIEALIGIAASVRSEALRADLEYLISETALARDTHEMEHANNMYKMLHDLDYFLLRYGPDLLPEERDYNVPPIESKYYGMLSLYW